MFKTILGMLSSIIIPLATRAVLSEAKESGFNWKEMLSVFSKYKSNLIQGFVLLFIGSQLCLSLILMSVIYAVVSWSDSSPSIEHIMVNRVGIAIAVMLSVSLLMLFVGQKKVKAPMCEFRACFESLKKMSMPPEEKAKTYSSADFMFDFVTNFFKPRVKPHVQPEHMRNAA